MSYSDTIPQLKGHWKLEVYEGDIKYGHLPVGKHLANACYLVEAYLKKTLPRKRHRGTILNKLIRIIEGDNLVTTSGKGVILDMLFGLGTTTKVSQMGVGTSNTAAAVGDTTLTGQVLQVYDALPTRAGLVVTAIATYGTAAANIAWAELASFNSVPTMLNRIAPIGPFTKTSAVSIVVTQTLTQS